MLATHQTQKSSGKGSSIKGKIRKKYKMINKSVGFLGRSEPIENFMRVVKVIVDEIVLIFVVFKDFIHSLSCCLAEAGRDAAILELFSTKYWM